jgi:hypothetical protein
MWPSGIEFANSSAKESRTWENPLAGECKEETTI